MIKKDIISELKRLNIPFKKNMKKSILLVLLNSYEEIEEESEDEILDITDELVEELYTEIINNAEEVEDKQINTLINNLALQKEKDNKLKPKQKEQEIRPEKRLLLLPHYFEWL